MGNKLEIVDEGGGGLGGGGDLSLEEWAVVEGIQVRREERGCVEYRAWGE